ncbi:adenylyltransferase/cytidyltransferase family protein [bacterium]|nr:adenylyltransferase/cytidyltransferase family protein [bacterium]
MARIVTLGALAPLVAARRAQGASIVLANGAFDLLHVGHVRYLRGAAALGDVLVVAVNSDASVARAKGEGRPILPLDERLALVAAIEGVDFVTPFEEDDVVNVLHAIRPDIHAKGTDYTEDTVPEVATVRALGGRTAIAGDPKDHNTTDIIARVRAAYGSGA